MATRRKITLATQNAWTPGETVQMQNGQNVVRWLNEQTGEARIVATGLHPDDQPLTNPAAAFFDEPQEEIEETAADRVATLLKEAAGQERAELNVYRIVQGAREYCQKYSPGEFEEGTFDLLRDRFGPGEYELRLYATHPETRKFVVRSSTRIKIAENRIPDAAPGQMNNGLAQVLQTIAQGQQQMLSALVEIKQTPPKDPMDEMTKMLSMMTMMREAMGMNNQREKSSISEIVGAIKELKGAAQEFAPEKEESDSLFGMLPKVIDLVTQGQQAQQQQQQQPMQNIEIPQSMMYPPQNAPMQNPVETNESAQATQDNNDMKALTYLKLRSYLKSLTDMAVNGKSIAEGANFVYAKLPDDLIEIMLLDNWYELLAAVAPGVSEHQKWVTEVRNAAIEMFEIDDEVTEENIGAAAALQKSKKDI